MRSTEALVCFFTAVAPPLAGLPAARLLLRCFLELERVLTISGWRKPLPLNGPLSLGVSGTLASKVHYGTHTRRR